MYLHEECKCELGATWFRLWVISRVRTREGQPLQLELSVDLTGRQTCWCCIVPFAQKLQNLPEGC